MPTKKCQRIDKIGDAGWAERPSVDMAAAGGLAPAPAAATSGATTPPASPAATGLAGGVESKSSTGGVHCHRPSSSSPKTRQIPSERTPALHPLSHCGHSIGHWCRHPNQDADKRGTHGQQGLLLSIANIAVKERSQWC